jgi:hypothetical protein
MHFEQLEPRHLLDAVPLLPDLVPWDQEFRGYNYDWFLDTQEISGRTLMRFSTASANIGDGPLILREGQQRIHQSDGTFTERRAKDFVFHEAHGHFHAWNYAEYNLYEVAVDDGVGALVATSGKIGFCLIDNLIYDLSLPNPWPAAGPFGNCSDGLQGINVGRGDLYWASLPDQWIDITDVPDGLYWFETVIDPDDYMLELDETNNVLRTKVFFGAPHYESDRFEGSGGNYIFFRPTLLGTGDQSEEGLTTHYENDGDSFRWIAPNDGTLNVDLVFDHALGDIDLFVLYVDGEWKELAHATTEQSGEHVSVPVVAGESYYIVVKDSSGFTNPDYDLIIDGPDISPDRFEPNDDFGTAADLGSVDRSETELTAHIAGDQDFFTWTAPETGTLYGTLYVDVRFPHLQGDLELVLYDADQTELVRVENENNVAAIEFPVISGQTYFIRVDTQPGEFIAGYELLVDLLDIEADPFEPNQTRHQPADIGSGDVELTGLTVHAPFERDFYRWSPTTSGLVSVDLLFQHEQGDLDLYWWVDGEDEDEETSTTDNEHLLKFVSPASEYLIEVRGKWDATNPSYDLIIDGPGQPDADLTGNGFVDFQDLTILLAAWNQNVSAAEGNLVDAAGSPVNLADLTTLLAAWTGPGAAGAPQAAIGAPVGRRLAAAQETSTSEGAELQSDVEREAPPQAAAYRRAARRDVRRSRSASGIYGRLQAVAVDRAMAEEDAASRAIVGRRAHRRTR